jgi:hypothetical protein
VALKLRVHRKFEKNVEIKCSMFALMILLILFLALIHLSGPEFNLTKFWLLFEKSYLASHFQPMKSIVLGLQKVVFGGPPRFKEGDNILVR